MKKVKLLNGETIEFDGKLLSLLTTLYNKISLENQLVYSTQQLADELKNIVKTMDENQLKQYLLQSLIVNFKFYEVELIKEKLKEKQNNSKPA